jgi:serine/threonine protein kinase
MREQHGPTKERQASSSGQTEQLHFGNYDLVRRIDVGGMGEVYLAHQRTAFGRLVAIKIIRPDLVHDVVARQRFLREAEVSAHLKHEHILQLVEFGEEQGRLFLVTPYVEGGTLARRLQRGPLSLAEMQVLFSALVSAVAYIHKRGVIHRDLKPSNILLDQEGDQVYVRLIDFGIATMQGDYASPQLTTAGTEIGTIEYMAPERLSGVAAPSNDIYSLGIILYQMITGHLPSATKVLSLPQPLEEVVQRATAPDPLERYNSADELLRAFEYACRVMNNGTHIHPSLVEDEDAYDSGAVRRSAASRQLDAPDSDSLVLRAIDGEGVYPPQAARPFKPHDYGAQTAFIDSAHMQRVSPQIAYAELPDAPERPKRRTRSLMVLISLSILVVVLLIGATFVLAFEATISGTVTISPQAHVLSQVFTLQAQSQPNGNVGAATVPLYPIQDAKTRTETGPTTAPQCFPGLPIIFCQRTVTLEDVDREVNRIDTELQPQITSEIQQKIAAQGGMLVSTIQFTNVPGSIQFIPPLGTTSDTVTVTLTYQGAASYVKASDARTLATTLLKQQMQKQFGPNYVLLNSSITTGSLTVLSSSANSVTLSMAAGGVAEYQFPQSELTTMRNALKGMTLPQARAYLVQQAGIDPNSIVIRVSYGTTMPGSASQIRIVPVIPSLPTVQLTPSGPAASSSLTPVSTAAP